MNNKNANTCIATKVAFVVADSRMPIASRMLINNTIAHAMRSNCELPTCSEVTIWKCQLPTCTGANPKSSLATCAQPGNTMPQLRRMSWAEPDQLEATGAALMPYS